VPAVNPSAVSAEVSFPAPAAITTGPASVLSAPLVVPSL